ncbi:CAP domain-containing protein [Conexibacter sp. SYSU D00693]|uniref:CAP domain-containing protein n=1 Tax=Conexibacter sp. SYSU D00693 TaxID=2812560 RepID=UPI00196A4260|nr:CAP domain-containing protein [Conexibacter sp. SYSU D00693]
MRWGLGAVIAAMAVACAAPATAQAACEGAESPLATLEPATAEGALVCAVNEVRATRGLRALEVESRLARAAREHSADMLTRGYFAHEDPSGRTPEQRVQATGYAAATSGENIARGQRTARQVVATWMGSGPHCRNIMSPAFRDIGTGVSIAGTFWTLVVAQPAGAGPAGSGAAQGECPLGLDGKPLDGSGSGGGTTTGTTTAPAARPPTAKLRKAGRSVIATVTNPATQRLKVRLLLRRKGARRGRTVEVAPQRVATITVRPGKGRWTATVEAFRNGRWTRLQRKTVRVAR